MTVPAPVLVNEPAIDVADALIRRVVRVNVEALELLRMNSPVVLPRAPVPEMVIAPVPAPLARSPEVVSAKVLRLSVVVLVPLLAMRIVLAAVPAVSVCE